MSPEDERDFREFVTARSPALLRTAYLLAGDVHGAQDLLQAALMGTARHWSRIRRRDQPDAYVRRAMVNQQARWWRQRARRAESPVAAPPERAAAGDHAELGRTATVARMVGKVKVTWEERPGEWVVVESRTLPEADVVRYAQELRRQPQPIPMPLDFAWLPAGMEVVLTGDGAVDESVVFAPRDGRAPENSVHVSRSGNDVGKVGDPLPVGDRTGYLSHQNGMTTLWAPLPGHGNISVAVPDSLGFTRDDLVRFTLGISNP